MTEADLRHKLNRNQEDRRKMNLQQQDQESREDFRRPNK
jgi:hypothetical protein